MKYVKVAQWSFDTYFEGRQTIQADANAPEYIVAHWLDTYSQWKSGNWNRSTLQRKEVTLKANKVRTVNVYA